MSEPTAQVSKVMHASPEQIWSALTDPKTMKAYFLGADIDADWRVGGAIHFRGKFKDKPYEDKGWIQTFAPQKRLAFSHFSPLTGKADVPENYHLVSFDLLPVPGGTKVILTQSNLKGGITASDRAQRGEFEKNWQTVLTGLSQVVE